ncbi:MAG: sugar phosphate isomerase/epimerase, partial [Bryobacteraceae bacterium]
MITRRSFLAAAAAAVPLRAAGGFSLKIGVMDGVLRLSSKPEAIALAKKVGVDGLQVTLGGEPGGDHLLLADPDLQAHYREESKRHGIP